MVVTARAVVFLCLWLHVVRGTYVGNMTRTIQNILQHYNIPKNKIFDGKVVFSREPLSGKIELQMLFMGGVLMTYEKLIERMLDQLPTPSSQAAGSKQNPSSSVTPSAAGSAQTGAAGNVREQLTIVLTKIKDLKKNRFEDQEKLLKYLQDLRHVQVTNSVIQSKALWELPWLYDEASSLSDKQQQQQQRRRRRHAKRGKTLRA